MLFFAILFTFFGVIFTISPKVSWWLSNWWRFEGDAEPSSISLFFYRIGGIIFVIVGIVLFTKLFNH